MQFICTPCKLAADDNQPNMHRHCPGGTWCDCQHRTDRKPAK